MMFDMLAYALLLIGTPYGWGKDGGGQYDCSGFVQELLKFDGIDPRGDQTSQNLFDKLRLNYPTYIVNPTKHLQRKSVLFFGQSIGNIRHVSMAYDNMRMIEAGGGNRTTRTIQDAINHSAMVRMRPIDARPDLVALIVLPQ